MKKIINAPDSVIEDYIRGVVAGAPGLQRVDGWPVVVRAARKPADRVALVSGGGSGHEPGHAGYVGPGMLDAAVLGPVFTSPSVDSVLAAIRTIATDAGVLLVVKNYTGDRLNFGLAAELARAEGLRVEMVVVADDAALGGGSRVGRRGLSAAVLAHKVAGAAAEAGRTIEEIIALLDRLLAGSATMGVALTPCIVPGASAPSFELGPDEVEWGLGIHGEPGSERSRLVSAREIAERLVRTVCEDRGYAAGTEVAVLLNSLGATPDLELRILHGEVLAALAARGLRARITWAGAFLTSLDMSGAAVTVAAVDGELLELLLAPSRTLAFPAGAELLDPARPAGVPAPPAAPETPVAPEPLAAVTGVHAVVERVIDALLTHEEALAELDRRVGDGDLGPNLARGARAVRAQAERLERAASVGDYLQALAEIVRREVGGTSGPLYSLAILAMADRMRRAADSADPAEWAEAAAAGLAAISRIGGAQPGDSTMVDALHPAVEALAGAGTGAERIAAAALAARAGSDSTHRLVPALGRSSYVGDRAVGVPDPGSVAIALQFEALAAALRG